MFQSNLKHTTSTPYKICYTEFLKSYAFDAVIGNRYKIDTSKYHYIYRMQDEQLIRERELW